MALRVVTFKVSEDFYYKLQTLSIMLNKPVSQIIREALEQYMRRIRTKQTSKLNLKVRKIVLD